MVEDSLHEIHQLIPGKISTYRILAVSLGSIEAFDGKARLHTIAFSMMQGTVRTELVVSAFLINSFLRSRISLLSTQV